ncbi:MAG TPA: hypothetical protein VGU70_15050 [Methylobacterium sp.]|uniref:hypothetical protein n=1 Tax=Methylorubrum sp. B1-46 TaxID=2897334 RepID=UPI001E5207E7|nr:hypothetical protein [Methylorubrum sp. B1-46]UGB26717.1 hypothetical protein LPC10_03640 [Methylorubrum sp. B1-46]HEV2544074.1 hypothetical protein [Methylobacterium sp.]
MSFLLRAALVIGALSFLALQRQEGSSPARPRAATAETASGIATGEAMDRLTTGGIGALVNAVNALPPETRDEMVRAGAEAVARHVTDQFAGQPITSPRPSADTLSASDRRPSWRGPTSH